MADTAIEWTDVVWNPVTGCTHVSEGCRHCYAEAMHRRFNARPFSEVVCHEDRLEQPLHWRKPRRVFVNSMSDLFHEAVPDSFIDKVFAVMALCPQHTFQVLTKRPERMREYLTACRVSDDLVERWADAALTVAPLGDGENATEEAASRYEDVSSEHCPLPNVWLGVSIEDQPTANVRVDQLLQTPAALRFVSAEPLLAPVDLRCVGTTSDSDPGYSALELRDDDEGDLVETLDWVIVGGESGPGARPCDVGWIRSIVEQCQAAAVPVFVKQLGANAVVDRNDEIGGGIHCYLRKALKSRKGSDPAEWPEDLRVREFPEVRS